MWKKFRKAVRKVVGAVLKIAKVVREVAQRFAGILDYLGGLVGIRPRKHLRLQVYILKDEKGNLVAPSDKVKQWVNDAARVYLAKANVELHPERDQFVEYLPDSPPESALYLKECSFSEGFSDGVDWFEDHARSPIFGYGGPVTVFVVGDIGGANGCSWWWMHTFCAIEASANHLDLAHEVGHVCGLWHVNGNKYLMDEDSIDGEELTNAQIAFFRNARYVTYLNVQGV